MKQSSWIVKKTIVHLIKKGEMMSKLTHHIEHSKFNTWIVRDLNKKLVYIGLTRNDAIKWSFNQNKENRKENNNAEIK